ncbi:MAG: hypothetical protein ACREP1_08115, partial [Rhodanobacteraceae bacterium]
MEYTDLLQPPRMAAGQNRMPQAWPRDICTDQPFCSAKHIAASISLSGCRGLAIAKSPLVATSRRVHSLFPILPTAVERGNTAAADKEAGHADRAFDLTIALPAAIEALRSGAFLDFSDQPIIELPGGMTMGGFGRPTDDAGFANLRPPGGGAAPGFE